MPQLYITMAESQDYSTMMDYQKVAFLEERLKDRTDELREKHGEVMALKNRLEAADADAYDFQKKSQQLESDNAQLRTENHRMKSELPSEVSRLNMQLKRQANESAKLQAAVIHKDEAIEKIKKKRVEEIKDLEAEIRQIDEDLSARNREVNTLTEANKALSEKVTTLKHHVDIEKGTADSYKEAADKYDAAGPALERLNKILANYLGDHLQDELDWPPGHPNNNMSKVLNALDDELGRANKKGTTALVTTREEEKKQGTLGDEIKFKSPDFSPAKKSSTAAEEVKNVATIVQDAFRDISTDDVDDSNAPSIRDTPSVSETKSKRASFKAVMTNAFQGKSKENENEFILESPLSPRFQTPVDTFTPPAVTKTPVKSMSSIFTQQTTPTQNPKAQNPGLNANTSGRIFSMFGNGGGQEEDSPKPSEKLYGDLNSRRRPRASRFTPRSVPEKVIEYVDREVPVPCTRKHVDESTTTAATTTAAPEKVEYVDREVSVPCKRKHVDDVRVAKGRPAAIQTDMKRADIESLMRLAAEAPKTVEEPQVIEKPIEVEKIVEKFVDRVVEKEKIVIKYQDRTVYSPRHPLLTIWYFYWDIYICLIEWAYCNTPSVVQWLHGVLPQSVSMYLITKALSGDTYEIVHQEDDLCSLQSARHAILARMNPEIFDEKFNAEREAAGLTEPVVKDNSKGKQPLSPPSSTVGGPTSKGRQRATTSIGASTKLRTSDGQDRFVTATQYIVRRPPFVSNLIMALLFTLFIPLLICFIIIYSEYAELLDYNGVIQPSWYTLPTAPRNCGSPGRPMDDGLFIVDKDWSWVYYVFRGLTGGWLKQLHFALATQASGGAGFRMPG